VLIFDKRPVVLNSHLAFEKYLLASLTTLDPLGIKTLRPFPGESPGL